MKTIKIIDLLNDLFDYRELQPDKLPKKIRFNEEEFVFESNSYYNKNGINIMSYINHTLDLRVEAEIIEEDKKIEKLGMFEEAYCDSAFDGIVFKKINELIDIVNEMKSNV